MCQDDFKEKTSNTDQFTKCFESEETIDIQFKSGTEDFLKHYTQVLEKYVFKIELKRKSQKWM